MGRSPEKHVYERREEGTVQSILDGHPGKHPVGHSLGNYHETVKEGGELAER